MQHALGLGLIRSYKTNDKNCPNRLKVYKNITEVNIAAPFISRVFSNIGIITVFLLAANYLFTMPAMCVKFVLCGICTPMIKLDIIHLYVVSTQFCLNVVTEQKSPFCQEVTAYSSRSIRFVYHVLQSV